MKVTTSILAAAIAFVGTSMADDAPVVTMTMPSVEGLTETFEFEGSVVEAGPSGTTMVVACEPKATTSTGGLDDMLYCQMWESATFVAGPSTFSMEVNVEADKTVYTQYMGCDIHSATHAVCTASEAFATSLTGTEYQSIPPRTITTADLGKVPVTITAGVEKLSATQTAAGTESTGAEPTGTDTGAAPRMTGAAHWAVGGMAAIVLAAAA